MLERKYSEDKYEAIRMKRRKRMNKNRVNVNSAYIGKSEGN